MSRASPKSPILAILPFVNNTFRAARSRWMHCRKEAANATKTQPQNPSFENAEKVVSSVSSNDKR